MVQFSGTYKHVSNSPEYEKIIKTKLSDEKAANAILSSHPVLTFKENGDQWTMLVREDDGTESTSSFKLGEHFGESTHGVVLDSVAHRDGDKLTISSKINDIETTKVFEFTNAGINTILWDNKIPIKGTRTYKRI